MNNTTKSTTQKEILRVWHLVDLKGKVLGRASVDIAHKLMGKSKPYFVNHLDCGDYVVVINAKEVKVTGNKTTDKIYYRHSMYPGGLKGESFQDLLQRRPSDVVMHAVKGMLPQNKLRATMLKRLYVFPGEEHKYQDKFAK